jgi:hypothetical protein
MATISVNPLNINYTQFEPAPASVLITFSGLSVTPVVFGNKPNWLNINNITAIDTATATALFSIETSVVNGLSAGNYTVVLDVFSTRETVHPTLGPYENIGSLTVNLTVNEAIELNVTPENISFNYTVGGALPSGKIVKVETENSFTTVSSAAWLSFSTPTQTTPIHTVFTVSVDPSALNVGTHTSSIILDDGNATKTIYITIVVSDGNTVDDYLYISPSEIEFVKNTSSAVAPTKTINLNSSGNWTAVSTESWLLLNVASGSSGSAVITLSLDTLALTIGVYAAEITFTNGLIIRKAYITLYLNNTLLNIPDNGGLYFSDDQVELIISSDNLNSYLDVDFKTVTDEKSILYNKKAPFIKGVATLNAGEECINIIESYLLPTVFNTEITTLLKPAIMSFTAYEKNYFTSVLIDVFERNSLNFLNGKTPETANKLCYTPSVITVSKSAVIALHSYSAITVTSIVISGAVSDTITTANSVDSNIYTAFINLANYALNPLDVITVAFDALNITVRIKEEPSESVLLIFENEWQLPEVIELTGGLSIFNNADFSTQQLQEAAVIYERIYNTASNETFSINTGYLESAEEVAWLSKILDSKKMYLFINSKKIEVIPTFRNLNTYKSREHQKDFVLTFKKATV